METAVGLAWFLGIYNDILQTCSCNYIGDHACHTCIAVLINGHAYAQGEKEKGAVLVDVIAGGHCIRRRQSCHFRVQTALRVAHLHCQPSDACPATPRAAEADSASTDTRREEDKEWWRWVVGPSLLLCSGGKRNPISGRKKSCCCSSF